MLQLDFTVFPELRTPRLCLRSITLADAPQMLLLRSDEAVMRYIDRAPAETLADAEALISKMISSQQDNTGITWVMAFADHPDTLIGSIGYWRMMPEHYRAEVGYMLLPAYWRKGLTKEALLAVIDYGFNQLGLHSIEANINPANDASAAILEATGFVREAYFRENYYYNGVFLDSAIYSRLRTAARLDTIPPPAV